MFEVVRTCTLCQHDKKLNNKGNLTEAGGVELGVHEIGHRARRDCCGTPSSVAPNQGVGIEDERRHFGAPQMARTDYHLCQTANW